MGQAIFDGETGNIFWQDIATEIATVFQQKYTLLGKHVIHINPHFTFYTRKSQNLNWVLRYKSTIFYKINQKLHYFFSDYLINVLNGLL